MSIDTNALNELMANRRTVFPEQYDTDKQVPDAIINQMLENANWAPNHGQTEPWRFIVYKDGALTNLAADMERIIKENAPNPNPDKLAKLMNRVSRASHIITIIMKRDPNRKIRQIEEIEAVACAVQNMHLTAAANGVGAFWSTGGMTYLEASKTYFGLEEEDMLMGFLFVGMPSGELPKGRRKPIADKVEWVI